MGRTKKRNHAQYAQDSKLGAETTNKFGVASTLSQLRVPDLPKFNLTSAKCGSEGDKDERRSEGWEIVDRRSKKQKLAPDEKKEKSSYPALDYAGHRLQASIKISDLQGLVIYTLADGTAPQWISVRHHYHIKKVMVLMVPGLENGMFDGKIPFHERIRNGDVDRSPLAAHNGEHESNGHMPTNGSSDNQAKGTRSTRVATLSPDDYLPVPLSPHQLAEPLQPLAVIFPHIWPVKTPGDDRYYKVHSPIHAMLTPPLPKSKEEKQEEKDVKGAKPAREGKRWENKRTRISAFLASAEELEENEYTLHPVLFPTEIEKEREMLRREQTFETAESGWVDTKVDSLDNGGVPEQEVQQGSLTAGKEILTMDCEMCKTEGGGLDLTRISIVSWDGNVVMDELVKPEKPIIDYLTPYSGITAAKLEQVTTTLLDIQTRLLSMLHPRSILIGHSLNSDLNALKLTHPFIIDTSIIYQHPRGPPLKSSLKWLSQKYLGREIQKGHGTHGHDSIEDARACLDLVKQKCEKGVKWGTSEAAGESIFKRLARSPRTGSSGISGNDDGKIGAIIDWGTPERNFGAMAKVCIGCENDEQVVEGVRRAVNGDEDGKLVPGGGVDFTWARLRELEWLRGWWNDNRKPTIPDAITHTPTIETPNLTPTALATAVTRTVSHITSIYASLPPCTLFIVYSGTGDPREMARLQAMQQTFKKEFQTKKWDQLSVKWTDVEEQALKRACRKARAGCGFVAMK